MTQRIFRALGDAFDLRLAIIYNGLPVVGTAPTFTLQSTTATSPNYHKFCNLSTPSTPTWSTTPYSNTMSALPSNVGTFYADINQALLSLVNESYLVVYTNTATVNYTEAELWEFGSLQATWLQQLWQYSLAPSKTFTRSDDYNLRESVWNAKTAGTEIIRIDYVQDPSGTQPEETRTNNSDLI